jgi:hypothetical protein
VSGVRAEAVRPGADDGPRYSALLTSLMRGSAASFRLR